MINLIIETTKNKYNFKCTSCKLNKVDVITNMKRVYYNNCGLKQDRDKISILTGCGKEFIYTTQNTEKIDDFNFTSVYDEYTI